MLTLTLTCLFAITAIATGLSLIDSWLRGRGAYVVLKREQALLKAGFIPQVHAHELRLRAPARRTIAAVTRTHARRRLPLSNTPLPTTQLAG